MSKGDSFVVQMGDILKEISDNVDDSIDIALNKVPKKVRAKLKATSPGPKKYRAGWSVKRLDKKTAVVYNSKVPGFTHLLENGHAKANQYGTYSGRVNGQPHIAPAEKEAVKEFLDELMSSKL